MIAEAISIKTQGELNNGTLTFRADDMPERLRERLAQGLIFQWHKALITYSDGTKELAESFREITK